MGHHQGLWDLCRVVVCLWLLSGCIGSLSSGVTLAAGEAPQGEIVYVSCARSEQYQGGDLYRFALDEGTTQRLTHDAAGYAYPTWSPDGKELLFTVEIEGESQIQIMDADGQNRRMLGAGAMPAWSPDGKTIVYAAVYSVKNEQARRYTLYLMDRDGKNPRRLTGDEFVNAYDPTWAPDGQSLVFAARWGDDGSIDLYRIEPTGGTPQRLSSTPDFSESRPAFSPDGTYLAFGRNDGANIDLYTMRPDGSELRLLTGAVNGVRNFAPAWSPEGDYLAFRTQFALNDPDHEPEGIYVIKREGGEPTLVIPEGCDPSWRPEGK